MSKINQIIAEIRTQLSKYDNAGLLDETTMYREIILGLKSFGNDICTLHDKMIKVEDGFGNLPDNFYSLKIAYKCDSYGYASEVETSDLISSLVYKETYSNESEWKQCDSCDDTLKENFIRENIYIKGRSFRGYYHNPILLKLGKTFHKSNCANDCRNMLVRECPYEISISNYQMHSNFNRGYVYIQYMGLPLDENGKIDMIDTPNGNLERHIEYLIKAKMAEVLIGNNDDAGLQRLYPIFEQKAKNYRKSTSNELKMMSLTPQALKRVSRVNRLEALMYDTRLR